MWALFFQVIIYLVGIAACVICALIGIFIYYAGQGKRVAIARPGYELKAKIYGKINKRQPRPAILFLSGWSPGVPITTSDLHAGVFAKHANYICLTVEIRSQNTAGERNSLTRADYLADDIAAYDFLAMDRVGL